jgi:hypothetical protein
VVFSAFSTMQLRSEPSFCGATAPDDPGCVYRAFAFGDGDTFSPPQKKRKLRFRRENCSESGTHLLIAFDDPNATPTFSDVTGFAELDRFFHFAQCARNEIHVPSHSELQRADRLQSDMVGLHFQTRFLLLDPLE